MVTRGQSPPDLLVSTVKYILQRSYGYIWAKNLLHRFSDAMQLCCALEVGTFFLKIFLPIAIMAILSSIPPLSNSQTSNKHFELTRDIFKYNVLSAIDSYRSRLVTRGKSVIRYVGMLRNYWKSLPSTKIVKTNFPSKNTGKGPLDEKTDSPLWQIWSKSSANATFA